MRSKLSLGLIFVLCIGLAAPSTIMSAICSDESFHDEIRSRDFEALQEFVNSKRTISFADKVKYLKFSGDIRTEIYRRTERIDGKYIRGGDAKFVRPPWTYDLILKFQVDYKCDRTWGQAKVEFDNEAGIEDDGVTCDKDLQHLFGSGFCDDICLKRAFFGYRLIDCPKSWTFDIEIGRRPLNLIFESYIQFKNRFDGILFKYDRELPPHSKFYLYAGPFIVNERNNHYAVVGEMGIFNFNNWMTDIRYSYIDWSLHHEKFCHNGRYRNPFRISQFTLDYNFPIEAFGRKAQLYGAFLCNHAAPRMGESTFSHQIINSRENLGGYAGFLIGEVKKAGDWAIDISYEVVQAQAIPDSDVSGIDRGNAAKNSFTFNQLGKTNYKGWEFQVLYAITDKLQTNIIYDTSTPENAKIGGPMNYTKFEMDIIHKF